MSVESIKLPVEIRQIDAWEYDEGVWTWNNSTVIATTKFYEMFLWTEQFKKWLVEHGMSQYVTSPDYYIMLEDSVVELRRSDNDKPLIAACVREI